MSKLFGSNDVGIDLGTSSVVIYVKGKGIVLREPSVVAIDKSTGRILEVGEEARKMLGRTPGNILAIRPLRDGVISDYDVTERMLRYFLQKTAGRNPFFRPRVVVCVPSGVTEVERRSVVEAALDAGARYARLIEEPIAAAIGAGVDISAPRGNMVVDIGGGTTDIAVISMGRAVLSSSVKSAGNAFDEAIVRYCRRKYGLLIGERTAENVKLRLGGATPRPETLYMDISGRDLASGLPKTVHISSDEANEALQEPLFAILDAIHSVMEQTPPELAADIYESGIMMTGGGALLYNMEVLVSERINIPCRIADDATSCVARGTGLALENAAKLGSAIFEYRRGANYSGGAGYHT